MSKTEIDTMGKEDGQSIGEQVVVADLDCDSTTDAPQGNDIFIDPVHEQAVMRKFDKYFLPQAFIILLLNYLDRSNLGNARPFGFDADIGLVGNQFGNIATLFFVPYILAEVPWVMAIKRFGPNYAIATAFVGWCLVTIGTGFVKNYAQAIACRMLLGFFEAGVVPGFGFIFSTIYDRKSTAKRIALINCANATAGAFGGLFAFAIQRMGPKLGLEAWRWLFIIEGAVICIGLFMTFPNRPETAWFLNAEDKALMLRRKQRDEHVRGAEKQQGLQRKWAKAAFTDPFVYLASAAFFFASVAIFGFGTFLPTLIRGFGYDQFAANYLTIPVYALGAASLLTQAYFSDRVQRRGIFLVCAACPVITAYLICVGTSNAGANYFAMFVLVSGVYTFSCLALTWVAGNLAPDYKLAVGLPLFGSIGNLSGLVASQLYPSAQGPRYVMGNAISAGMESIALCLVIATWFLLRRRNQLKDKQIAEGATTNGLEGDRALGFRYCL